MKPNSPLRQTQPPSKAKPNPALITPHAYHLKPKPIQPLQLPVSTTWNWTWSNTRNPPYAKPDHLLSKTEPDPILATTEWIQPITKDMSNTDARTRATVKECLWSVKVQVHVS